MAAENRILGPWALIIVLFAAAGVLFYDIGPVAASEDHDEVRALRGEGAILPLAELLARPELQGQRVLEAELEREDGRLVYELELLDEAGRVRERYFDATSGAPLGGGDD
jgi:uncharacterized membrane protein YkoI